MNEDRERKIEDASDDLIVLTRNTRRHATYTYCTCFSYVPFTLQTVV